MMRSTRRSDELPQSHDLRALLSVTTLPPVPDALRAMWQLPDDLRAAPPRLAGIVERDPVLTSDLLRVVAGVHAGFGRRAATVLDAVSLLGAPAVKNLAIALLVKQDLLSWSRRSSQLDRAALWKHSVGTAFAATRLAALVKGASPVVAHAAGLLHDLGIVAVDLVAPQVLGALAGADPEEAVAGEDRKILGAAHVELGRMVAERWHFPEETLDGIAHHHAPMRAPARHRTMACLVCVADVMTSADSPWWCGGGPQEEYERAVAHLGLQELTVSKVREAAEVELAQAGELLRMVRRH
jgi:putative nucleotidyltransferase with HDIG domain